MFGLFYTEYYSTNCKNYINFTTVLAWAMSFIKHVKECVIMKMKAEVNRKKQKR